MLLPKPRPNGHEHPVLRDCEFSWLVGELGPAERRAMREIAERGDLAEVGGRYYLVAPVSPATVDALAAFEAEGDDRENDLCDEPDADREPDVDDEPEEPWLT
jgi:hypothetical protein